jgi:hypothetical protein
LNSTIRSIQGRLGRVCNLPVFWDDIQSKRHQDALFECIFVTSEGTEGGRLNLDASYKERLEWQTCMVCCSNISFVEYLARTQRHTTAGMRRVFEIEFNRNSSGDQGMVNTLTASQVFGDLQHNYGTIGEEYARLLARDHEAIGAKTVEIANEFMRTVNGAADESFWFGLCGVLIAGASLAQRFGVEIDIKAMHEYLIGAFHANRQLRMIEGSEGGSYEYTVTALTDFFKYYRRRGNVLFTDILYHYRETQVKVLEDVVNKRLVYIQVARDRRLILISRLAFRDWLENRGFNYRQVCKGLLKHFQAVMMKRTLGAGTIHIAFRQEVCWRVPVPEKSLLEPLLTP